MDYTPSISSVSNPIYKPLDATRKQIRILTLHPGAQDADLHGSLATEDLDLAEQKPHYETISYCWGDASLRSSLLLHGYLLNIPASTAEALRGLRHESDLRHFWIDSVCINQNDVKERGQQVSIMASVFKEGSRTMIWLGSDDEHTQNALNSLHAFLDLAPQETLEPPFPENDPRWPVERVRLIAIAASNMPPIAVPDIAALKSIFLRPWFRRLWVFQEVLVSRECICCMGSCRFEWQKLQTAAAIITYLPMDMWSEAGADRWHSALTLPMHAGLYDRRSDKSTALFALLSTFQYAQSSDPRDKVYGLLALTRWGQRGVNLPRGIQPDYSITTMQCFREATRVGIAENNNLTYISRLEQYSPRERHEDWPSWIYDLSNFSLGMHAGQFPHSSHADNRQSMMLTDSGHESPNSLFVSGYQVQAVASVMPIFMWGAIVEMRRIQDLWKEAQIFLDGHGTHDFAAKACLMLTTAGHHAWNEPLVEGSEGLKIWLSVFRQLLDIETGGQEERLHGNDRSDQHHTDIVEAVKLQISWVCRHRRAFRTESCLGLGPGALQEGDVVAILFGCPFPVALRPVGGWYELLGPCYVYGIMDGEIVKQKEEQGEEPERFEIR